MGGDELLVLAGSLAFSAWMWASLFQSGSVVGVYVSDQAKPNQSLRALLACVTVILGYTLLRLSASDVRSSALYITQYAALGLAWVYAAGWLAQYAGVSLRDDLIERRNPAAFPGLLGLYVGLTLAYSGANIGEGPSWWVVVFSALLSTGAVIATALALGAGGWAERVTVERELHAGIRGGAALAAAGLVAGRAAAGDWIDARSTFHDFFHDAWPILVLAAVALAVERGYPSRPPEQRTDVDRHSLASALIGGLYLAAAALWIWSLGAP